MAALRGLTARLLAGQALVILAGSASLVLVATAIAPGIFHRHVRDALGSVPHGELAHLDHAFQDTLVVALAIAITVAAVTALAISLLLATRIAAPIRRLADAADRVSHGEQGVRVSLAGADELRTVSASFNTMASALEQAEHNRRAFVSDISHELRTPLATIDGYLEGLTDGVVPSSPDTWHRAAHQTLRMRRLVDDLATLTRAEEGRIDLRRERRLLQDILRDAAEAARVTFADKQIDLAVQDATEPVIVNADPVRLGEVLANLLENAARHTPSGGKVTLAGARADDTARITIADTGDGIPPDQLEHIFDRFHRIDTSRSRQTGGSGLGLAISRALIHAHHGTITAQSDGPGQGSRFIIDLPHAE